MKNLFVLITLIFALTAAIPAKAQQHKFYYYPESNVYYSIYGDRYIYYANDSWVTVKSLPATIKLMPETHKVILFHTGPNIWLGNPLHVKKYMVHKPTPVKVQKVTPVKVHKVVPVKMQKKTVKVYKATPKKVKVYKATPAKKKVKLKH